MSTILHPLTFEERQVLKQMVSDIQIKKEKQARRLEIVTLYDNVVIHMGGGSRHWSQQIRSGYPYGHGKSS
jgi:hypothetical protein